MRIDPAPLTLQRMKRWTWIPLVLLVVLGAAAYLHESQKSARYTATGKLLFNQSPPYLALLGYSNNVSAQDSGAVAATNVALATLPSLADATLESLPAQSRNGTRFSASSVGDSNLVDVSATAFSPADATEAANAYLNAFLTYEQGAEHRATLSAASTLSHQISREQAVGVSPADLASQRATLAQLQTLAVTNSSGVSIVQRALGASQTGPAKTKETAFGVIIGLVAGLLVMLVAARLDDRAGTGETIDLSGAHLLEVHGQAARASDGLAMSLALHRVIGSTVEMPGPRSVVIGAVGKASGSLMDVAQALGHAAADTIPGRVAVIDLAASAETNEEHGRMATGSNASTSSPVDVLESADLEPGDGPSSSQFKLNRSVLAEYEIAVLAVDLAGDPTRTAAVLAQADVAVILSQPTSSRVRVRSLMGEVAALGIEQRFLLVLDRAGIRGLDGARRRSQPTSPVV
jgi:capsular polysaccharide biosynthesis protein